LLSPVGYDPSYITLNLILSNFAFSLLFSSIDNVTNKKIKIVVCGFLLGFIPFNQITAGPLIIATLLFIFHLFKSWNLIFLFIFGSILSTVSFFLFFETPARFLNQFFTATAYLSDPAEVHGLHTMFFWITQVFKEVGLEYFLITFVIYLFKHNALKWIRNTLILVIFGLFLVETYNSLLNPNYIFYTKPIYIILLGLIIYQSGSLKKTTFYIILFLLSIPILINLGTNVPFYTRSAINFPIIALILLLLASQLKHKWTNKLIVLSFTFCLLNYLAFPFRGCWENSVPIQQNKPAAYHGSTIYLDEQRYTNYRDLKPLVYRKRNVITISSKLLGTMLLCEATPPIVHAGPSVWLINEVDKMNLPMIHLISLKEDTLKMNQFLTYFKNHNVIHKISNGNVLKITLLQNNKKFKALSLSKSLQ